MQKTKSNQSNLSKVMGELVSELKGSKISCDEFIDRTVQT